MTPNDPLRGDDPDAVAVVRQRVADNLRLVVAALLVIAVVSGWISYAAHVNPPTEPTERTVGAVETGGEFEHGAVVRSENPVYPVGDTLADRRHYFHSVSPVLNGSFVHDYVANGTDVVVETTLSLRLRSADTEGEYWSVTEPLADRRVDEADAEGSVAVPFAVNVTEATRRIAETTDGLGGSPGDPELTIVAETTVGATVDGRRVTTSASHELPVTPSGPTYSVGPARVDTASERVTRTEGVPPTYGPVASIGAVLVFPFAVFAAGLVVLSHRRGSLRPSTQVRTAVATARERTALDEWITTGHVPREYRDGPTVSVTSLSGLVDVGIDSDRRVIEDADAGGFYVVDGDLVYSFEPADGRGDRSGLDESDGGAETATDAFERQVATDGDGSDAAFRWTEAPAEAGEED